MNQQSQFDLEFYKKHYGGLEALNEASAEDNAQYLKPGSRYWLAGERIIRRAEPGQLIAEMGCGDARMLFEISRRANIENAIGVDGAYVDEQVFGSVKLLSANLNEPWPLEDGSVDHMMSMMVIEHLFDPFFCFREIRRALSPTGRAYINLPLVTGFANRLRLLRGDLPITSRQTDVWFEDKEWDGGHLHYFSLPMIRRLAAFSGLEVEEIVGVGTMHRLKTAFPHFLASEITFSLKHSGSS